MYINFIFFNISYGQEELDNKKAFSTTDLSFLAADKNQDSKIAIWPWNGCKEFSITLTTGVGIEIEFSIINCCVRGVCIYAGKQNPLKNVLGKELPKQIQIKNSSEVLHENYVIKVKDGLYNIDVKTGEILDLEYIVLPKL
ncbi:hypothetical protein [Lacinutrix himadriensis]|uniref:hypothetical protein n=1 Tax=Lacinutrix himadriensis TaxID=641549 RepID=UPI0006E25BB7|nr:hypothetical protein [Lacinutrix himadriensis]